MILFFMRPESVAANSKTDFNYIDSSVIEYLRLSVPAKDRESWLIAEKLSWEPWLNNQEGFRGRQLFWDSKTQEAVILITWSSRTYWKRIPQAEINEIQMLFEKVARDEIGMKEGNPFPIQFAGELLPQK